MTDDGNVQHGGGEPLPSNSSAHFRGPRRGRGRGGGGNFHARGDPNFRQVHTAPPPPVPLFVPDQLMQQAAYNNSAAFGPGFFPPPVMARPLMGQYDYGQHHEDGGNTVAPRTSSRGQPRRGGGGGARHPRPSRSERGEAETQQPAEAQSAPSTSQKNAPRRRNPRQRNRPQHGQQAPDDVQNSLEPSTSSSNVAVLETAQNNRTTRKPPKVAVVSPLLQSDGSSKAQRNPPRPPRANATTVDEPQLSLRERLMRQLGECAYECMICCQVIKDREGIWSCEQCHHMFHISGGCISDWAKKQMGEMHEWRCPSCARAYTKIPRDYTCFCGRERNPSHHPSRQGTTPHSCGQPCKRRRGAACPHPCGLLCHPGPCPDCPHITRRPCACRRNTLTVRCGGDAVVHCTEPCNRLLNCGEHRCEQICHDGPCQPCDVQIEQVCFCGAETRTTACTIESAGKTSFGCQRFCEGRYDCGEHVCLAKCHEPLKDSEHGCGTCPRDPAKISSCPCGKATIRELLARPSAKPRSTCSEPLQTCGKVCGKLLGCGPDASRHRCQMPCHEGDCAPCPLLTTVACRCGTQKKQLPCGEARQFDPIQNPMLCAKKCKKLKSCGVHRCAETCCVEFSHPCLQVCGKMLSCGQHRCDALCHAGRCRPCLDASFTEQACLCGRTVREPPVPCGAPLPECSHPCARQHDCQHDVTHSCHAQERCPPCTALTKKWCFCGRVERSNVPCHLNDVSCGRVCDKPLPCGVHWCQRACHGGPCIPEGKTCTLPCPKTRMDESCEHACAVPCHGEDECPRSECQKLVPVTCGCGLRKGTQKCGDIEKAYARDQAARIQDAADAPQGAAPPIVVVDSQAMRLVQRGQDQQQLLQDKYKRLSCDSDCVRKQRNARLADALDLPTVTTATGETVLLNRVPGTFISYPDFLRTHLKEKPDFCRNIEEFFISMVDTVNMNRPGAVLPHHFLPMRVDDRRFIHEYAPYFKIATESVDQGQKRSVVATAKKDVSMCPQILLTSTADVVTQSKLEKEGGAGGGGKERRPNRDRIVESIDLSADVQAPQSYTDSTSGMRVLGHAKVVKRRNLPEPPPPVGEMSRFALLKMDDGGGEGEMSSEEDKSKKGELAQQSSEEDKSKKGELAQQSSSDDSVTMAASSKETEQEKVEKTGEEEVAVGSWEELV